MDDLEIKDKDGDSFRLSEAGEAEAFLEPAKDFGVYINDVDATRVVNWLQERFGLVTTLETVPGVEPGLAIDVETETGKTRSVRWYGPEVPGELIKLAEIALRLPVGATAGSRPAPAPAPESLVILRQLMGTLGCERVSELPGRVQGLMRDLDNLAGDIAQMAGVEIGPDGANLRALLEKIQERHREAIANVKRDQEYLVRESQRRLQAQAREHHAFRETVPMQIENALSTERNARAAVQRELDEKRKQHAEALRQLRAAELLRQQQTAAMDEVGEALRRAGVNDAPNLRAGVQELARARDLNAGAAASFAGKLEKAREGLQEIAVRLTADAGPDDKLAGTALKMALEWHEATDPDA